MSQVNSVSFHHTNNNKKFLKNNAAHIFRSSEQAKKTRSKQQADCSAYFLLGLLFDPEDGGITFL
jgi:hypothetical protein